MGTRWIGDWVPPDAVEPFFKQIVNQFVHDHSLPEAIAVGLNVIRELCLRMPLLMNEDLLPDLVMYKKTHEKAVSSAARSLKMLFTETGGLSNRQKEVKKKKNMPMAAKRDKEKRSRQDRKRKQRISGKQSRGKKAWK